MDRFHFKSHTCSEILDQDSYFWMDVDRTTTAESLNARIEKSVPYLRFVKEQNLIPHLNIRFALINVVTRYRRRYQTDDLEDVDVWEYFKETVPCACESCSPESVTAIEARENGAYVVEHKGDHNAVTTQIVLPSAAPVPDSSPQGDALSSSVEDQVRFVASHMQHIDDFVG